MTIWMDLEGIMLSERSQTEKYKYHMISLVCGIQKQNKTKQNKINENQTKTRHRYREQSRGYQRGKNGKLQGGTEKGVKAIHCMVMGRN